jgi:hypothetical protein
LTGETHNYFATAQVAALDEILLKALEGGDPVTIRDITKRLESRLRNRLLKLRVRGLDV